MATRASRKRKAPESDVEQCACCIYFVDADEAGLEEEDIGICRRYPRTALMDITGEVIFAYPQQQVAEWCGEFKRKTH